MKVFWLDCILFFHLLQIFAYNCSNFLMFADCSPYIYTLLRDRWMFKSQKDILYFLWSAQSHSQWNIFEWIKKKTQNIHIKKFRFGQRLKMQQQNPNNNYTFAKQSITMQRTWIKRKLLDSKMNFYWELNIQMLISSKSYGNEWINETNGKKNAIY